MQNLLKRDIPIYFQKKKERKKKIPVYPVSLKVHEIPHGTRNTLQAAVPECSCQPD